MVLGAHGNGRADLNRATLDDPRIQTASVYKEAHHFFMRILRPDGTGLAQFHALELALTDIKPLAYECVEIDAPRYKVSSRLMRCHGEAGLCDETVDLLGLNERHLLTDVLSVLRLLIAITFQAAVGDGLYGGYGFHLRSLLWSNEYVFDSAHVSCAPKGYWNAEP